MFKGKERQGAPVGVTGVVGIRSKREELDTKMRFSLWVVPVGTEE